MAATLAIAPDDLMSDADELGRAIALDGRALRRLVITGVNDGLAWSSSSFNAGIIPKGSADGSIEVQMKPSDSVFIDESTSLDELIFDIIKATGIDTFYPPSTAGEELCNNFILVTRDEVCIRVHILVCE
jgi:hypothetical protein